MPWASPSGSGCTAWLIETPNWEPSPIRRWNGDSSFGVQATISKCSNSCGPTSTAARSLRSDYLGDLGERPCSDLFFDEVRTHV